MLRLFSPVGLRYHSRKRTRTALKCLRKTAVRLAGMPIVVVFTQTTRSGLRSARSTIGAGPIDAQPSVSVGPVWDSNAVEIGASLPSISCYFTSHRRHHGDVCVRMEDP